MNGRNAMRALFLGACLFLADASADYALTGGGLDEDLEVDVGGVLAVEASFDLRGNRLVLANVTDVAGVGAICDSVGGGVLDVEAVGSFATSNASHCVVLSGGLRFVKRGPGAVTMAYPQTYSGGTEIREGELTTAKRSMDEGTSAFGCPPEISIYPDGCLDTYGGYRGYASHVFNLHGGRIVSDSYNCSSTGEAYRFAPTIRLFADSSFVVGNGKTYNFSGTLRLDGRKLDVVVGESCLLYWRPESVTAGRIDMTGAGTVRLLADVDMPEAELRTSAALDLQRFSMSVSNYVPCAVSPNTTGTGSLKVYGSFVPNSAFFHPPTMQSGSTIDLSGISGAWDAGPGIWFASGAEVFVDVGDREVAAGEKLVEWNRPNAHGFRLRLVGGRTDGLELSWDGEGVRVVAASEKVVSAEWTGAAGDCDLGNPANWRCISASGNVKGGALPDGSTAVEIPYAALLAMDVTSSSGLSFATVSFSGGASQGAAKLSSDRDWRGLGAFAFGRAIDIAGHRLDVELGEESVPDGASVESSVRGGELHVFVPAGCVHSNGALSVSGDLVLFKEGAGALVAARCPQTHIGEVVVEEGVLMCAAKSCVEPRPGESPFGRSRTVVVRAGGVLDPAGSHSWSGHTIVLEGGTIGNTVAERGTDNSAYNVAADNIPRPFNPEIVLSEDSAFTSSEDFNFFGRIVPDGHVLQVRTPATLRWAPGECGNAAFEFGGGGVLKTLLNFPVAAPASTICMRDMSFDAGGDMTVLNYVAAAPGRVFSEYRNSKPRLNVRGAFTPADGFFGCTMLDGSSIRLSDVEGVWSTRCAEASGGRSVVDFAKGAVVTIDVRGRRFACREKIVSVEDWAGCGADGVTFRIDDESRAAGKILAVVPPAEGEDAGSIYVRHMPTLFLIR